MPIPRGCSPGRAATSGESGFCYSFTTSSGEDLGVCSLMCAGYCPDQGNLTTFCGELEPGAGFCLLKADAGNGDCANIPGTVATQIDRFVGSSGAPAATSRVCLPDGRASEENPPTDYGDCCGDYDMVCGSSTPWCGGGPRVAQPSPVVATRSIASSMRGHAGRGRS
jgi:hypothetical protein